MKAIKELENKFFNDHFFEEELNKQDRKIDFVAELMEESHQEQLRLGGVVGQSEQFNCLIENENKGIKACTNCCGEPECKINNN